MEDINSAFNVSVNSTTQTVYKYNAAYGRINYNLLDKYIINATIRRDGSSRFGDENKFHNFLAMGGAWIFSGEPFMNNNLPFISFGKLRASYGTTGSDQLQDYRYLDLYNTTANWGVPYQGITSLEVGGIPNPYLQWEETRKLQMGIVLGILNDRLLFNGTYYRNRSSNQLLDYSSPSIVGAGSVAANLPGTLQNSGWELSASSINIKKKNFYWNTQANITLPRNKLLTFPGIENSSWASFFAVGEPFIGRTMLYHYLGVNSEKGVYQFEDKDGKPTTNPSNPTDKTVIITTAPKFYGGIGNNFSFKGFNLDVFLQYSSQMGRDYSTGWVLNPPGNRGYNVQAALLNRWQKAGDESIYQRYSTQTTLLAASSNVRNSDFGWVNVSYIRLKNVSLSWSLPKLWQEHMKLQNARIFMHAQNLLTITKYKGLDPENQSITSLPPLIVITIGLQVSF